MKLGAKISISMILLALLATGIASLLAGKAILASFNFYVDRNFTYRMERMQALLSDYYAQKGSWEEVQYIFDSLQARGMGMGQGLGMGQGQGRMGQGMGQGRLGQGGSWGHGMMGGGAGLMMGPGTGDVLLVDENGKVIAASDKAYLGKSPPPASLSQGLPLVVNDRAVGTLIMVNVDQGEWEKEFINSSHRAILWAALVATVIALILGLLITKHLTGPLAALSAAARRLAGRDLGYRAPVLTRDEIGDLARSFNNMAESLEQNEKLRKNLIADVAHELRTPLAILRGNLESLQEGVIKATPEVVISLHDEVVRISRLVSDLQDLSLADAGELRLHQSSVPVEGLIEKVAVPFSGEAKLKNIDFSVAIQADLPAIRVDQDRLVQVLLNILGNALRHTGAGGRVVLSARREGQEIIFSVKDSGTGIAPDELASIFERFYRSEPARSRAGGGTGLGLAIAKGIVEAHGGRIWAESRLNEGSTFTFTIPLEPEM